MVIRKCVPESEQGRILYECHASPYGGNFAGDKTTHKILQSGFIGLPYSKIFFEWVKLCDECQRMSKTREIPISGIRAKS